MNAAVLFCLTATMTLVWNTLGSDEDELIRSIYAKCREETQIEENEMEAFKKMEMPTTSKGQCMMGCLMREAAIIVNGRFDKEGAMRVAERYYSDKQEEMEKARTVIDICEKQIENETEECDIAGKLATCVIDEAQKPFKKPITGEDSLMITRDWDEASQKVLGRNITKKLIDIHENINQFHISIGLTSIPSE